MDIHTGNRVGIKSAIDIFRKVAKLFGQDYHLPKELRTLKGLQLDPLKKRKKKSSYSSAGKALSSKKFRSLVTLSDTESEHEENNPVTGAADEPLNVDENLNVIEESEEDEISFMASPKVSETEVVEVDTDLENVLPVPKQIRQSREKIALFAEQGVAQELLSSDGGVMGADGTPLATIGKTITTPITIGGKLRAINNLAVANETRDNLVRALIHQCERLGTLAGAASTDIWKKIIAIMTDLASENTGLARSVSEALGMSYIPGQGFCVVHTVLGFDEGLKQVCLSVQNQIGTDKLLVNSTSSSTGTDLESFDLASYAVDMCMRPISPTFSNKPWSRYSQFCVFMESKGHLNMAFALKDRRFGRLCATSAVCIHHWEDLKSFLDKEQASARNVVACLVRSVLESDVTKLLVLSNALVGIHLEEPFLHMLITMNATQEDLLNTLPHLYTELKQPDGDPLEIVTPCLPALGSAYLTAPYQEEIMDSIRSSVQETDKSLLQKYVRLSLSKCADVLERQRGPAYGIGCYSSKADPMYIRKQVPDGVSIDSIPSHNLGPEHIFGDGRQRLRQFGDQCFNVMREGITIAHNEDLAFRSHEWKTPAFQKIVKKARELSAKFEKDQKELKAEKVVGADNILEAGRKEARLLNLLKKKHNGPITSADQVDELFKVPGYIKDPKKFKIALENEVSFAKTLFRNIPAKSPLFIQRKNTIDQLANNLRILYGKNNSDKIEAGLNDLENAMKEIESKTVSQEISTAASTDANPNLILHQYIALLKDSKIMFGTVIAIQEDSEHIVVDVMKNAELDSPNLFIYPPDDASLDVVQADVLPLLPVFSLNVNFSARTNPVWELENFEAFKSMT